MNDKLFLYKSIYSSYLTFGFNVKNFYEKRVLCKGPLRRTGILEQYILYLQVYYTSMFNICVENTRTNMLAHCASLEITVIVG